MKQYRITTENLIQTSDDDCHLAPDDPIHEIKAAAMMGGLGADVRIQALKLEKFMNSPGGKIWQSKTP